MCRYICPAECDPPKEGHVKVIWLTLHQVGAYCITPRGLSLRNLLPARYVKVLTTIVPMMIILIIMNQRLLVNLTVLFSSVVLIFAVCEIFARVFYVEPQTGMHRLLMQHDELLGWKKIPNNIGTHVTDEFQTRIRTNSKGTRGPEYPYVDDEADLRIVVLGDSFAEGYTVEFEDLFSEILRYELNREIDGQVDVINLGTAGYSTDQELLLFQTEGKRYQQHLTLLMFYENDVWFNSQDKFIRGYKPLFEFDRNELRLTNFPVPKPEERYVEKHFTNEPVNGRTQEEAGALQRMKRLVRIYSSFYRFVSDRIKNSHVLYTWAMTLGLAEKPVRAAADTWLPDEFRIWKVPIDEEIRQAWEITEGLIGELKREVEAAGSQLIISYIPNKASASDDMWAATMRKYGLRDEDWRLDQPRIALEAFCERNGIGFLDLTPRFRLEAKSLAGESSKLYFEADPHWNVHGNRLAGELIADFIKKNGLDGAF